MQHALKLFWRPKAIELEDDGVMTYEKVEIIRRNDGSIRFNNKMPYHVTLGYINDFGGLSFYEINCPVVNNICNISVANRDQ